MSVHPDLKPPRGILIGIGLGLTTWAVGLTIWLVLR
jgi:hypothetical protein